MPLPAERWGQVPPLVLSVFHLGGTILSLAGMDFGANILIAYCETP
jgi:hypothetical protein